MTAELLIIVINNAKPDDGIDYGSIIETIVQVAALCFTVWSFSNTNNKTKDFQKRETRKNWFLTIIIQPNLSLINSFYENTFTQLDEGVRNIKFIINNPPQTGPNTYILEEKSEIFGKFQKGKSDFNFSFIEMVKSYNNDLAKELNKNLNTLEDIFVNTIDDQDLNTVDLDDVESQIHQNKSIFFNLLFKEVDKA